jgi:hypothetical protein
MVVGVGLFGTLTAFLASHFVQAGESRVERELAGLRGEIAELRQELSERNDQTRPREGARP